MAKIVCILYDDPIDGYPPLPDFIPGQLLGSVSGELGLRRYLESQGHTLVVTSDKDGENSRLDQELPDAKIVIPSRSGLPVVKICLTCARKSADTSPC